MSLGSLKAIFFANYFSVFAVQKYKKFPKLIPAIFQTRFTLEEIFPVS